MAIPVYAIDKLIGFILPANKEDGAIDRFDAEPEGFVDRPNEAKQVAHCAPTRKNVDAGRREFRVRLQERLYRWLGRMSWKSCGVWVSKVVAAILIQRPWYVEWGP